jgi:hypothetical protein
MNNNTTFDWRPPAFEAEFSRIEQNLLLAGKPRKNGRMLASLVAELGTGPILADDEPDTETMDQIPVVLRPALKSIVKGIQSLVSDIINSDANSLKEQFNYSLLPFTTAMVSLGIYVTGAHDGDIKKLAEYVKHSNIKIKSAIAELDLVEEEKERVLQIQRRLYAYQEVIFGIMMHRPTELEHAISTVNLEDFVKSLYGTMLSISCITTLDDSKKTKNKDEKLAMLVEMGSKYSEGLSAWTDTIDIYSDPETRESLARSDKWYREHDSDYAKIFPADVP